MLPLLLTTRECAQLAGISERRIRALIAQRAKVDRDLVVGTKRRPLIRRDAFARLVGIEHLATPWLADYEARLRALERRTRG